MTVDVQAIKQRTDLVDWVSRDVHLKKVATTRGGEWAGPCPFCGGRDRFRVQPRTGLWFCRQCSPDGRWQDAIAFVMRRDGVPFTEACRILGASPSELGESTRIQRGRAAAAEPALFAEDLEPTAAWRERAHAFVQECAAKLWTDVGARARGYLRGRGLKPDTLRTWHVGFLDADRFESPADWGLPELGDNGKSNRVWLPRGVTLPWYVGNCLWMVKVRRATDDPKYWAIRGGHPLLYGADTLVPDAPAVMFEGELDTLVGWQAVFDRTATISLGSASRRPTHRAALLLSQADPLLAAYDVDVEGERGVDRLQQLAPRIRRIRPPEGKDVGQFVAAGGRARAWLTFELARLKAGH